MNRVSNGSTAMAPCESEKSKDWQLEILMEKLRSKTAQYKTLPEISKNVRMTMLDKRYAQDSVDKSQHQKCLDTLQQSMKVTSLQSMVERLESLTRQLGLKFVVGPSDVQLFISSDMFYLEILLDTSGAVQDVKVHHEGKMEQQSCAELVSCLSRGDFQDFTAQLEGFASIYQLNAEKKVKSKAFTALQSLESDLITLAQLQSFMKEPFNLIYKSPVGILEKRRGGHPMRLTYFISPYDLINISKGELEPISVELISSKNLGYSVTVCMEGSASHKLQTTTLITVSRTMNGKSSPSFAPLSGQNSSVIPATFVLKLNKPLPMCVALARQLQVVTELEWVDFSNRRPLLDLIVSQSSNGKLRSENNRGLFVNLPDQNHCYFMTDNKNVEGILLNSIPFTHPTKVAQILVLLRQQALFNTLISSCVRPKSQQTFENVFMLEITALSWTHISISLEHPTEESMATAEMDLSDICRLTCKIHTPGTPPPPTAPDTASELVSQVLNKSFSIPVMIRSIIKFWERQSLVRRNHFGLGSNGHENFSLPLDSCDPGGGSGPKGGVGGPGGGTLPEFDGLDGGGGNRVKQELCHTQTTNVMQREMFLNESIMSNPNFPNFPSSEGVLELLGAPGNEKNSKRGHKRSRSGDESWRSKSRKAGEEDVLLESSNSSDSTSGSTFLSHQDVTDLANSNSASMGFQSDLELSTMDSSELVGMEKAIDSDRDDMEEEINDKVRQNSGIKSPMDMLSDLNDKNLVPSNVSITPISNTASPSYIQGGIPERRSSVELSGMSPSQSSLIPSTITITPLPQVKSSSEDKYKERKSSKSKSDEKSRMEKKRKRKRDESPMGPPEKIPHKQDPLSKPVSVSIKPAESPPPSLSTPSSPGILKYSASPTHRSLSGKLSPSLAKQNLKGHHSPKHSPAHIPSSPKHSLGISSPKNHGASPKHPSASGSGKPSMSTLKNATNSPNSKSESKTKSGPKESSRDKEKKQSSTFQSASSSSKNKSSSKTKTTDSNFNTDLISPQENQILPGGPTDSSSNLNQARRKGMLSAIVDKLKSAQHCESGTDLSTKMNNRLERDRSSSSSQVSKSGDSKSTATKSGDPKNSEYMVKPSSDGIKLTINKTRTKDAVKSAGTKTGSPKVHTGLKPGVNSGPASKKPQQQQLQNQKSTSSVSQSSMPTSSKNSPKLTLSSPKSSSVTPSMSSSNKSSKASASGQNKDRLSKLGKSSSEKSVFSSREKGKSSPTPKEDPDTAYKYNSSIKMEGLVKQLDKNFQIPKLSARMGSTQMDDKKSGSKENPNNLSRSPSDSKIYDLMPKGDSKYPLAIPNNKILESMESKMRNNMNSITQNQALLNRKDEEDESGRRDPLAISYPISNSVSNKTYGTGFASTDQPLSLSMKTAMDLAKFAAPDAPRDKRETKKGGNMTDCDMLLDFSKGSDGISMATAPYPSSPSVSVHIVKSPAPHPSPRAISPRLADDELVDETFVGLGK